MTSITIPIAEDRLVRLKELAAEAKVSPEELVRVSLEEWLQRRQSDFAQAANYVLQKNAELYRRLA